MKAFQFSANAASTSALMREKHRFARAGTEASILTDIYEEASNLVIWQRSLTLELEQCIHRFIDAKPNFNCSMTLSPQQVEPALAEAMVFKEAVLLRENIQELVDMFCCLFDLKRAGLRLSVLNKAMCPKFHVDRVPCRLITTFHGIATEWLAHEHVNRNKLGVNSMGVCDSASGIYQHKTQIQQISCGDVALLKGELWPDNEGAGLVHRSPTLNDDEKRLLLTLDFID